MGKKSTDQEVPECKDCLRILQAVQRKPLRFSQIRRLLKLEPAWLEYHLEVLRNLMLVIVHTVPNKAMVKFYEVFKDPRKSGDGIAIPDRDIPTKCKILVEYSLSKRGASVLRAHAK